MRKFHVIIGFSALLGLFSIMGCKKETITNNPPSGSLPPDQPPPPPPQLPYNTVVKANAGQDILVLLPSDFGMLYGSASHAEDLTKFTWKKISGPPSYNLETPESLGTRVANLEKGVYEFELSVTVRSGAIDKDTTTVSVGEISSNPKEMIFNDLYWGQSGLLWGSFVEVINFYTYFPVGNVFKVYIQRDGSPDWVEVVQMPLDNAIYSFVLINGRFGVYSDLDETDTPNLKIVY